MKRIRSRSLASKKQQKKFPWQQRKEEADDPQANKRIDDILKSPSYIIAEEDDDFLQGHSTLGLRLELDYQKAEFLLQDHGIEHTVVVFGGTRIVEKQKADRDFEKAQKIVKENPSSAEKIQGLKSAQRKIENSHYYEVARAFGALIGLTGKGPKDSRVTLMTGGGPGIMEAANRGAFDVGAKSIGLNILLPHEQFPNPYVSPELCFRFHYFATRKFHFLLRTKAIVVFPGGYGTVDELFEVLTLIQTKKIEPMPVILMGKEFWDKFIDLEYLEDESLIDEEDLELFRYCEKAQEALDAIENWYKERDEVLFKTGG